MMLRKVAAWTVCVLCALVIALSVSAEQNSVLVDAVTYPELAAAFSFRENAQVLEIFFPQIADCDAALLRCDGETMLIDCATPAQAESVVDMLKLLGVEKLDWLVSTHPHLDHIGGFDTVTEAVKVERLCVFHPEEENEYNKEAFRIARRRGIPVVEKCDGDRLTLGGAVIDVWLKCEGRRYNLNERSAQLRIAFGERTVLFTADAKHQTQKMLLKHVDAELLDVEILKYPHHGKDRLARRFTAATSPLFAVITNSGGERCLEGRKCLTYNEIPFAVTTPGTLFCATDGEKWLVRRLEEDELRAYAQ